MTTRTQGTKDRHIAGARTDFGSIKDRFGGGDLAAAVLGMLTAFGMLALVGLLLSAGAAGINYQPTLVDIDGNLEAVDIAGSLVAIGAVFLAFLVGGFAAGRISRFDGALNGFGAALLFILMIAVFAALGAWVGAEYNAFAGSDLPNWFAQFDANDITLKAIAAAAAGITAACLAGYIGGSAGAAYNLEVDAAIAQEAERA